MGNFLNIKKIAWVKGVQSIHFLPPLSVLGCDLQLNYMLSLKDTDLLFHGKNKNKVFLYFKCETELPKGELNLPSVLYLIMFS